MLRDRGNIKWTAMMLTEHIEELRKWEAEGDKVKRPELTEWDMEEIQAEIDAALRRKCHAEIRTWKEGEIRVHAGIIEDIDTRAKRIRVDGGWIDVGEIVGVRMVE